MRRTGTALFLVAALLACAAWAQPAVDRELAPSGKFRVEMNGNNSALVIRHADGTVGGLCAELGKFIAGKQAGEFCRQESTRCPSCSRVTE
jgi:hypothetical protein